MEHRNNANNLTLTLSWSSFHLGRIWALQLSNLETTLFCNIPHSKWTRSVIFFSISKYGLMIDCNNQEYHKVIRKVLCCMLMVFYGCDVFGLQWWCGHFYEPICHESMQTDCYLQSRHMYLVIIVLCVRAVVLLHKTLTLSWSCFVSMTWDLEVNIANELRVLSSSVKASMAS